MKRSKILLIEPPFQKFMDFSKAYMPMGLLSLATTLQRQGHEVQVYDMDYNPKGQSLPFVEKIEHYHSYIEALNDFNHLVWKNLNEVVDKFQPNIVGISMISTKLKSGLKVAERLRVSGIERIIAGGVHATIDPKEVFESPYIDGVVSGEGEEVFEHVVENGGIIRAPTILDINKLGWIARDSLVNLSQYDSKDLGMVMSSRGCPYSCNFCCSPILWGQTVRNREISDVVAEIEDVHNKYNVHEFYIIDDTFTVKKSRVLKFCDRMKGKELTWSCLTRVNVVDEEVVRTMKESGCHLVKVGLESGSERVLKLMNKRINKEDTRNASRIFRENGLDWMAYFIVGVPGETIEEVDETIAFIEEIKPTFISFSNFTPYPGTEFYREMGLGRIEYHKYNHHSVEQTGQIPIVKILEVAKFADDYNQNSKEESKR